MGNASQSSTSVMGRLKQWLGLLIDSRSGLGQTPQRSYEKSRRQSPRLLYLLTQMNLAHSSQPHRQRRGLSLGQHERRSVKLDGHLVGPLDGAIAPEKLRPEALLVQAGCYT